MPKSPSKFFARVVESRHQIEEIAIGDYEIIRLDGNGEINVWFVVAVSQEIKDMRDRRYNR